MRRLAKASPHGSTLAAAQVGRLIAFALAFAMAALCAMALAASALAAPDNYVETGSISSEESSSDSGKFDEPRRVDVYEATGEVFIVDRDNNRVQVFEPQGGSVGFVTQFGASVLDQPFGIAIDQSNGDVYVSSAGSARIEKFNRGPGDPPSFAVDPTFASPTGAEIGNFAAPLAVDPTDGTLWVADSEEFSSGGGRVSHFSAAGALLGGFDGSTSANGEFAHIGEIELDNLGNVLVGRDGSVERFSPGGAHQLTIDNIEAGPYGYTLAVNAADQIIVGRKFQTPVIEVYEGTTLIASVEGFAGGVWGWHGLAVNQASGALYAVFGRYQDCCETKAGILTFRPATRPTLTVDPASGIGTTSAHLSGTVNPNGAATKWHFEYSEDGVNWTWAPLPVAGAGSGTAAIPVEVDLQDLPSNRTFHIRLVAESGEGRKVLAGPDFSTLAGAPLATTRAAAPVTSTAARLNGLINPYGLATTYSFEYGADSSYGQSIPAAPVEAGSGGDLVLVSQELTGLAPSSTLHYRIVATNSAGTTQGEDRVLTTRAAGSGPPARGIELVNTPDKGNQTVFSSSSSPISPDGNQILWSVNAGAPGGTTGTGNTFIATRTATGWKSENFLPDNQDLIGKGEVGYKPARVAWESRRILFEAASGILSASPNTVIRMSFDKQQQALHTVPLQTVCCQVGANPQANDDLSRVYTTSTEDVGVPQNLEFPGHSNILDISDGTPELVNLLPNGEIPFCGIPQDSSSQALGGAGTFNFATDPAAPNRLYFESAGNGPTGSGTCDLSTRQLYLRDLDADTTALVSGPALPGGGSGPSLFLRASSDGSEAVFETPNRLTPEDSNASQDLYRFAVGAGSECLTCQFPEPGIYVDFQSGHVGAAVSDDLSRVYFNSSKVLRPAQGGSHGATNLYVLHEGEVDFVAEGVIAETSNNMALTPSGEVAFFRTAQTGITTDDTAGHLETYRYDDRSGAIECVTCPRGRAAKGSVTSGPLGASEPGRTSLITADGSALAFVTLDPLDPRDVNGEGDIYEWRDGRIRMVTDGVTKAPEEAFLTGLSIKAISATGNDILFSEGVNLTGYERDNAAQLYVARENGGYPRPESPPASCVGDACQGPLAVPPATADLGSAVGSGPGNATTKQKKQKKKRAHKQQKKKKKRQHGRNGKPSTHRNG